MDRLVRVAVVSSLFIVFAACDGNDATDPDGGGGGDPVAAPSGLAAFPQTPERASVRWMDNSADESGFELQRSDQPGGGWSTVETLGADAITFVDSSLDPETTYYYRVRALGDTPSDYTSVVEVTTLPARDPSSPIDCERDGYPCSWAPVDPEVFDRSDALGDTILEQLDDGATVAEALAWIGGRDGVADAMASDAAVRFRLDGGRPTWVLGPDAFQIPEGSPSPPPARPIPEPSRAVVGDQPKSKRALVLSVYQYDFGQWDEGAEIATLLSTARGYEGNVDYYANTASEAGVSPAQFKGWDGYQAVHVSSHGVQICRDGDCKTVILAGATSRDLILSSDDTGGDLVKIEYGERDYGASTDFFRRQYPQGLPNTIVFVSACQTAKGSDLADALTQGGGAYLGWTENVFSDTARRAALDFFGELVQRGTTATDAHHTLSEGANDRTLDRENSQGKRARLEVSTSGDDLRIREVVFPQNPLTEEDLPQDAPYPVVGQPEDGEVDEIPYLIKVDGVDGDPSGFVVNVTVNGFAADPKPLSEGEMVGGDPNVWRVKGKVPVTFDAAQGQQVEISATVDLPEGGQSRWDEDPRLGNPEFRFRSTLVSQGGVDPFARLESEVEAEFRLALDDELERLEGEEVLSYVRFDVDVTGTPCSLTTSSATDGRISVVDGAFAKQGERVLPTEILMRFASEGLQETVVATCPEGSGTFDFIHFFAGYVSFHGGQLCGGLNEIDQARGGFAVTGWTGGSGSVWARKTYDRSCTVDEATFSESTSIEVLEPGTLGG